MELDGGHTSAFRAAKCSSAQADGCPGRRVWGTHVSRRRVYPLSPNEGRSSMTDRKDVIVIGGGITGLTAGYKIVQALPECDLSVLEATDRLGGIVGTANRSGATIDIGPHGFIDNGSDTRELVDQLGIADELVGATAEASHIFLLKDDVLHEIPGNLLQLARTPLLTLKGKVRLLSEVFVPRQEEEDSVVDFVTRRFGREAAEKLAIPAVRGVVGGDANSFSIEGEFPIIKELERRHRSVLIGAVRNQRRRHKADPVSPRIPSFREFGRRLKTFHGKGMQRLVDALETALGDRVVTGTKVEAIDRTGAGFWRVRSNDGEVREANHVLVALPSDAAAGIVRPHHPDLSDALSGLPHPDIRVAALCYRRAAVGRPPSGIGFIAQPGTSSDLLGAIHASAIFPDQAPKGTVMIRVLAGGRPESPILTASAQQARIAIHGDLQRAFDLTEEPIFGHDHVWRRPIPTYPVGHRDRFRSLLRSLSNLHGLHVAGNSYFGVGVNDCVRDANRAASQIIALLGNTRVEFR